VHANSMAGTKEAAPGPNLHHSPGGAWQAGKGWETPQGLAPIHTHQVSYCSWWCMWCVPGLAGGPMSPPRAQPHIHHWQQPPQNRKQRNHVCVWRPLPPTHAQPLHDGKYTERKPLPSATPCMHANRCGGRDVTVPAAPAARGSSQSCERGPAASGTMGCVQCDTCVPCASCHPPHVGVPAGTGPHGRPCDTAHVTTPAGPHALPPVAGALGGPLTQCTGGWAAAKMVQGRGQGR
jgi:hypothetical protein